MYPASFFPGQMYEISTVIIRSCAIHLESMLYK